MMLRLSLLIVSVAFTPEMFGRKHLEKYDEELIQLMDRRDKILFDLKEVDERLSAIAEEVIRNICEEELCCGCTEEVPL